MAFPRQMLRRDRIDLRFQPVPEAFTRLNRFAGIQTLQKKLFQFLLGSLEVGSGGNLHRGDGSDRGFLSGTIRAGIDDGPNPLFLLWGELEGHGRTPAFSSHNTGYGGAATNYKVPTVLAEIRDVAR